MAEYGGLRITAPDGTQRAILLDRAVLTLGRERVNDIQIQDPKVSRRHARIECSDQGCAILDLGSANGTFVNGQPVEHVWLSPNDVIQVGDHVMTFVGGDGADTAATLVEFDRLATLAEVTPSGAPLAPTVRGMSPVQRRRRGLSPIWLILLGFVLVLLVALAAGALLMRDQLAALAGQVGLDLSFMTSGPSIEYVVDASLRMADTGHPDRFDVARRGLSVNLQDPALAEVNSGLRVFGNGLGGTGCDDTAQVVPIRRDNAAAIGQALDTLQPGTEDGKFALTEAILQAIDDLKARPGPHTLVVVTGGHDSCVEDSAQIIQQRIDETGVVVEIVFIGYQLPEDSAAELSGLVGTVKDSTFIATQDPSQLTRALDSVQARVVDPTQTIQAPENETLFEVHIIDSAANGASDLVVDDLDLDGDLDVVVTASLAGSIMWYENDGTGSPQFRPHVVDANVPGAAAVALGDMDRSGTPDLLSLGGNDVLWWAAQNLGLSGLQRDSADTQFSDGVDISAADMNGDGLPDIVGASRDDGNILWWRNDGDSPPDFERIVQSIYAPLQGVTDIVVVDIDGDGDMDVAAVSPVASVVWAENTGGDPPSFTPHPISHDIPPSPEHVTAVDIDGDGDIDLLVTDPTTGQLVLYLNEGQGQDWTAYIQRSHLDGLTGIDAHDMNRDGYLDLVTTLDLGDEGGFTLWESGGGQPPSFLALAMVQNNHQFAGAYGIRGGDMDGDGDADAAATVQDGNLVIWLERVGLERVEVPDNWCEGPASQLPDFCREGPAQVAVCGNQTLERGEQCEPGTDEGQCGQGLTCNPTTCRCQSEGGFCGDGVLDPVEECDVAFTCGQDAAKPVDETPECRALLDQCDEGWVCGQGCVCEEFCGNGVCTEGETSDNCREDCEPECGNDRCEEGETNRNCSQDCSATCGDNFCNPANESCQTCSRDCGACGPTCGNNRCESGESCSSCSQDCGACGPVCGNNHCESGENYASCPSDCSGPSGACPAGPGACCGDGVCQSDESGEWCGDCVYEAPEPVCGDGVCESGEDCSADCYSGPTGPVCGNNACESGESCSSCPGDCGSCPAVCGNGIVESGEECDPPEPEPPLPPGGGTVCWCSSACGISCSIGGGGTVPYCGDGICNESNPCSCKADCDVICMLRGSKAR